MSLKKDVIKSNLFFTVGRTTSAVIAFFFSIILARLLQPYDFGLYSLALVIVNLFVVFTDFGMNSILTRFTAEYMSRKEYGKVKKLLSMILKYKIILTLLVGVLISLFSSQIATLIFNKPEASLIVFLSGFFLIFSSLFNFFYYLSTGLKNFAYLSILQISESGLKFIIVLAMVIAGMAATGAVWGLILTYAIIVFIFTFVIYKKYRFIFCERKTGIDKKVLSNFGLWIFFGSIAENFYALIDQFLISIMLSVESLGFYKIAYTWMWSIIYVVPIAGQVLYPYFSSKMKEKQINLMFFNSIRYSAIFIFPLAFILSAFSRPLIMFLYKESFIEAARPLAVLSFVSIPIVFTMILTTYFTGIKKPEVTTKNFFVMIFINAILSYFLISFYGIMGAAFAILIAKCLENTILLSVAVIKQKLLFKLNIILKPLAASVVMYLFALTLLPGITNYFTFAICGVLSLFVYFVAMLLIKGIKGEDLYLVKRILRLGK